MGLKPKLRTEYIGIRVTSLERQKLEELAAEHNCTLTDLLLKPLREVNDREA